jgi:class 3 adenylate cyclase
MPRIELIGGPRAGTEGNRRVIREAFAAHGGDEVDAQGDSFLDVFGRAQDAALAAAQAQRALTTHEWLDGVEFRVRMGRHTAEPGVSEEGYHGAGVHRAARVMAAGHEVGEGSSK